MIFTDARQDPSVLCNATARPWFNEITVVECPAQRWGMMKSDFIDFFNLR
jgi:hypothetical protein